jgi:hypothetical protein
MNWIDKSCFPQILALQRDLHRARSRRRAKVCGKRYYWTNEMWHGRIEILTFLFKFWKLTLRLQWILERIYNLERLICKCSSNSHRCASSFTLCKMTLLIHISDGLGLQQDNVTEDDLKSQNVKLTCNTFHSRPSAIAMHKTFTIYEQNE